LKYGKPAPRWTRGALEALSRYDWPGNVRQLENLVERLIILGSAEEIGLDDLPAEVLEDRSDDTPLPLPPRALASESVKVPRTIPTSVPTIDELEKQAIFDALYITKGNVKDAATMLGYGQATVYRKISVSASAWKDWDGCPTKKKTTNRRAKPDGRKIEVRSPVIDHIVNSPVA